MSTIPHFSRRHALRAAGVCVLLPWLESLGRAASITGRDDEAPPTRFLFVATPNGAQMDLWTPAEAGTLAVLPPTLQPLEAFREQLLVLSGLTHDKARANGDGPGDHARSAAAFLTASQPLKTAGADLRAGVSIDQVLADRLGARTRLRSLELGTDSGRGGGSCDSGYACAYSSNISWRSANTPCAKEIDPRLVFERLFSDGPRGESDAARAERLRRRRSLLDSVRDDAKALTTRLSAADRRRMDEYMGGIRELERRIELAERQRTLAPADAVEPSGVPGTFAEHVRVLGELIALAFATDSTRVASLMLGNEGSNRSYADIGVPEGHHEISHHGDDPAKRAKVAAIDRHHVELFAHVIAGLAARREGGGTLLDHTVALYGSGISDGNRHNHEDLPILLAGRGAGLASGRHLRFARETPCANLFVTLRELAGGPRASFGDSTGALDGLSRRV